MDLENLRIWAEIVRNLGTGIAILIGGGWAFWRFIIQRERHPKIEFTLDLHVLGNYDNTVLVELIAIVENKGLVRHSFKDFHFDLLYLPKGGQLESGKREANKQVLFQKEIDNKLDPWRLAKYFYRS